MRASQRKGAHTVQPEGAEILPQVAPQNALTQVTLNFHRLQQLLLRLILLLFRACLPTQVMMYMFKTIVLPLETEQALGLQN